MKIYERSSLPDLHRAGNWDHTHCVSVINGYLKLCLQDLELAKLLEKPEALNFEEDIDLAKRYPAFFPRSIQHYKYPGQPSIISTIGSSNSSDLSQNVANSVESNSSVNHLASNQIPSSMTNNAHGLIVPHDFTFPPESFNSSGIVPERQALDLAYFHTYDGYVDNDFFSHFNYEGEQGFNG